MVLTYYGHSCFKLRSKETSVVTDPYLPSMVGLKLPQLEADIVTISHDHQDHNHHAQVKPLHRKQLFTITGPGEYEISSCAILGLPSFHDAHQGTQRGKNLIYVIELEQLRIAHLGDLGHQLSKEQIGHLGEIHILLVPVGGTYTISGKTAAELTSKIGPQIAIPMHYQLPGLNQQHFSQLTDASEFISHLGVKVSEESKLVIKKSDLPEEMEVVILRPKI